MILVDTSVPRHPEEPLPRCSVQRQWDLARRQELQKAVEIAAQEQTLIGIKRTGGALTRLRFDLTCCETHLEGTDEDGGAITIPYSDIESVSVSE